MNLANYFKEYPGTGILSTANSKGEVNSAIYARPHFLEEGRSDRVSFIMRDRLSHSYLQSNPNAAYLFIEEGPGYKGTRLTLRKVSEETDREKISAIRRSETPDVCTQGEEDENLYLVHFEVKETRPLVG